jgi:hypothetical protein
MKLAEEAVGWYSEGEKENLGESSLAKSIPGRGDWSPVKSVSVSRAVLSAAAPPAWDRAIEAWQDESELEGIDKERGSADSYI